MYLSPFVPNRHGYERFRELRRNFEKYRRVPRLASAAPTDCGIFNFPALRTGGFFPAALGSISREGVASGRSTPNGRHEVPPRQRAPAERGNETSVRNFRFRWRSRRVSCAYRSRPWDFRSSQSRNPLWTFRRALTQVRSSAVTAPLPSSRRLGQAA